MAEELIVIESGYKMASNNHKILTLGPFNASEAQEKYQELFSGTSSELPAAKNTTVVTVSERQFLRVRNGLTGATILDRVTRGTVAQLYPVLIKAHGLSIRQWFSRAWPAIQLGFVSRSSVGTLPLTQRVTERNLGAPRAYASFAVPLGATAKMDDCASICQAISAIFGGRSGALIY